MARQRKVDKQLASARRSLKRERGRARSHGAVVQGGALLGGAVYGVAKGWTKKDGTKAIPDKLGPVPVLPAASLVASGVVALTGTRSAVLQGAAAAWLGCATAEMTAKGVTKALANMRAKKAAAQQTTTTA